MIGLRRASSEDERITAYGIGVKVPECRHTRPDRYQSTPPCGMIARMVENADHRWKPDAFLRRDPRNGQTIRGFCHPTFRGHLDSIIKMLEKQDLADEASISTEERQTIREIDLPIPDPPFPRIAIKRFAPRSPFHRLAEPLTPSGASRAYRMGRFLIQASVSTPHPVLAIEKRQKGFIKQSILITEMIPDTVSGRQFLRPGGHAPNQIPLFLKTMAEIIRRLHDAGIMHRDLTLGNFLLRSGLPDQIYLIDLSRAIRWQPLPVVLRMIDLARLNLKSHWDEFYRYYCAGHPRMPAYRPLLSGLIRLRRASVQIRKLKRKKIPS